MYHYHKAFSSMEWGNYGIFHTWQGPKTGGSFVPLPVCIMFRKIVCFTHKLTAREISARCQIPLTADLGKYLGVPLIHKRVSKTTYYHILEKVQDRLAGWKAEQLSMAGRTLLVQSVTSAIPVYTIANNAYSGSHKPGNR